MYDQVTDMRCTCYSSDMKFGFFPGRSTAMGAAPAHDVIDHSNSNGSAVYACSPDVEAAPGGISRSCHFSKFKGCITR